MADPDADVPGMLAPQRIAIGILGEQGAAWPSFVAWNFQLFLSGISISSFYHYAKRGRSRLSLTDKQYSPLLVGLVGAAVQGWFCRRTAKLFQEKLHGLLYTVVIGSAMIVAFAGSVGVVVGNYKYSAGTISDSLDHFYHVFLSMWLYTSAGIDVLNSTAVFALIGAIITGPLDLSSYYEGDIVYIFWLPLPALYSLSLFTTLHSRDRLVEELNGVPISLSGVPPKHNGTLLSASRPPMAQRSSYCNVTVSVEVQEDVETGEEKDMVLSRERKTPRPLLVGLVAILVQGWFTRRTAKLFKKKLHGRIYTVVLGLGMLLAFAGAIGTVVGNFDYVDSPGQIDVSLDKLYKLVYSFWLYASASVDVINSATLCYLLKKRVANFNQRTDGVLRSLMKLAIETGSYTSIIALTGAVATGELDLMSYYEGDILYIFWMPLPALYSLSLFTTLHSRDRLVEVIEDAQGAPLYVSWDLQILLSGICIALFYQYLRKGRFSRDSRMVQALVIATFALDMLAVLSNGSMSVYWGATQKRDIKSLWSLTWVDCLQPVLIGAVALFPTKVGRVLYTLLKAESDPIGSILLVTVNFEYSSGAWAPALDSLFARAPEIWLWSSCFVDVVNSATLCYLLKKRVAGFNSATDSTIHRVIRLAVETGSYTAVMAFAGAILSAVLDLNSYYVANINYMFWILLTPLYTISLLTTLESRDQLAKCLCFTASVLGG
ncbi:hypothetical protein MNV49_001954 [Pseudohyphozyma bogoriensis]|nr:hypothetical protein MNV49_001954 [Pseudohyphozyma bogoriensis]